MIGDFLSNKHSSKVLSNAAANYMRVLSYHLCDVRAYDRHKVFIRLRQGKFYKISCLNSLIFKGSKSYGKYICVINY